MPAEVCVDASIAVKLVVPEIYSDSILTLWEYWIESDTTPIAPPIFPYEVSSVLRRKVFLRKEISPEEAEEAFAAFLALDVQIESPSNLLYRTWSLAEDLSQSTLYDTAYVALAEIRACLFWTADQRFYDAAKRILPFVRWIGNYE